MKSSNKKNHCRIEANMEAKDTGFYAREGATTNGRLPLAENCRWMPGEGRNVTLPCHRIGRVMFPKMGSPSLYTKKEEKSTIGKARERRSR